MADFVPDDFEPPYGLIESDFVLEPLGPEHNERDYAAWTSSIEHIRSTPGLEDWSWPQEMPLEENLADLEMHARPFASRAGFTYPVLDPRSREVIGCVSIYPAKDGVYEARIRSWVRAARAELDGRLRSIVSDWIASDRWPFRNVLYAPPR